MSRLLVLAASRHALHAAADELLEPATERELAALSSLIDRGTLERAAGWLRRRGNLYRDATAELGEESEALAAAADAAARSHTPRRRL